MDVEIYKVFNQLWLRACEIKVYYMQEKNKLPEQIEFSEQNLIALNNLETEIKDKCCLLQKLNIPLMVQGQQRGPSLAVRV